MAQDKIMMVNCWVPHSELQIKSKLMGDEGSELVSSYVSFYGPNYVNLEVEVTVEVYPLGI